VDARGIGGERFGALPRQFAWEHLVHPLFHGVQGIDGDLLGRDPWWRQDLAHPRVHLHGHDADDRRPLRGKLGTPTPCDGQGGGFRRRIRPRHGPCGERQEGEHIEDGTAARRLERKGEDARDGQEAEIVEAWS
jgi:hypothetical protein